MRQVCLLLLTAVLFGSAAFADDPKDAKTDPDQQAWDKAVDKAIAFLKSTQTDEGTWGGTAAPGMTGIVVQGLLRSGKVKPDDPVVAKAMKYLESLADPEGHLAGPKSKVNSHNYPTCTNLIAFSLVDPERSKYKSVIDKAATYLKKLQWDESEEKTQSDVIYGGAGYGGGTRPDLSNTHFFLDALAAAKVPKSDPAYQKALVFVSRCQNFKNEAQDQPWAEKVNDGSFIYTAAGDTRGAKEVDGMKPGYGSMTYAGLKSMLACGLTPDDPRCKKALEWLRAHYTVEANPGMPSDASERGLYYYLLVQAKTLHLLGEENFADSKGQKHPWRNEILASLLKKQKQDGSWVNGTTAWMEGNPDLCTAYSLITLSYCKPVGR